MSFGPINVVIRRTIGTTNPLYTHSKHLAVILSLGTDGKLMREFYWYNIELNDCEYWRSYFINIYQ